ncbi:hypothetical protein C8A03DRAFT_46825 [Achaetomium macrosporum]|uniref:Uncharacterized protein n=1 Tax=Achaetomium macrosporum TaxID=79813 RepID=A0AAN7H902_9PEZI|nr:hypothetical protein C8A03DRAFT_46825 [Achaetomium macrosporum]
MRGITSSLLKLLALLLLVALAAGQRSSAAPLSSSSPASAPSSQTQTPPYSSDTPASTSNIASASSTPSRTGSSSLPPLSTGTFPPDVLFRVPELHVGRIELDVDDLRADLNLNADIARLVALNVGVQVGVSKVNITIADVDAKLDLVIRLGNLAKMVNRTLASLDLNPLLITVLNEIISRGNEVKFLIDNLGNIVQEVAGGAGDVVSSIVGNYEKNMTFTGVVKDLGNGLKQKTYRYDPLGSLVNIIFNTLGQVVQAVVIGKDNSGGSRSSSSSIVPTSTASGSTPTSSATQAASATAV